MRLRRRTYLKSMGARMKSDEEKPEFSEVFGWKKWDNLTIEERVEIIRYELLFFARLGTFTWLIAMSIVLYLIVPWVWVLSSIIAVVAGLLTMGSYKRKDAIISEIRTKKAEAKK